MARDSVVQYGDFHQVMDKGGTTSLAAVYQKISSPTTLPEVMPSRIQGAAIIAHAAGKILGVDKVVLLIHNLVILCSITKDVQDNFQDKGGTRVDFLYYSVVDTMVVYKDDSFASRPQLIPFLLIFVAFLHIITTFEVGMIRDTGEGLCLYKVDIFFFLCNDLEGHLSTFLAIVCGVPYEPVSVASEGYTVPYELPKNLHQGDNRLWSYSFTLASRLLELVLISPSVSATSKPSTSVQFIITSGTHPIIISSVEFILSSVQFLISSENNWNSCPLLFYERAVCFINSIISDTKIVLVLVILKLILSDILACIRQLLSKEAAHVTALTGFTSVIVFCSYYHADLFGTNNSDVSLLIENGRHTSSTQNRLVYYVVCSLPAPLRIRLVSLWSFQFIVWYSCLWNLHLPTSSSLVLWNACLGVPIVEIRCIFCFDPGIQFIISCDYLTAIGVPLLYMAFIYQASSPWITKLGGYTGITKLLLLLVLVESQASLSLNDYALEGSCRESHLCLNFACTGWCIVSSNAFTFVQFQSTLGHFVCSGPGVVLTVAQAVAHLRFSIAREYDSFPQFNIVALIIWPVAWLSQLPVIAIFSWETFNLKLPALFIQFLRLCILLASCRCYTDVILHCSCIASVKAGDIPSKITDVVAVYSTKRAPRKIKRHAAIVMKAIDVKVPYTTRKQQDRSVIPDFSGDMTKQHYFRFCLLNQYMQHRGSASCSLVCPGPSAAVCSLGRHELCVQHLQPPFALCLGQTGTIATVMLAFQPLQLKGRVSCTKFCPWILPLRSGGCLAPQAKRQDLPEPW